MKKLCISNECIACGNCLMNGATFIEENDAGKAVPKGTGSLTDEEVKSLKTVVENCPVGAISIVGGSDSKSLEDVIKKLLALKNYKISRPDKQEFICDKSFLKVAAPTSGLVSKYSYRDDDKAESEGLRAFNAIAYSQRAALAQSALVLYKEVYLNKFTYFAEDEGCYYHVENNKVGTLLHDIAKEVKELTNGSVIIPENLLKFSPKPIIESSDTYKMYVCQFEELRARTVALKNVEDLDWYETFVNSDEMELSSRSLYRYDLNEVVKTLVSHIVDGCMDAIRDEGVTVAFKMIDLHQEIVSKELSKVVDKILAFLENKN